MSRPRISIITPCLNRASLVREAVESVLAQSYSEFEHIVMDGGSTDDTLKVLSSYAHLRVVSRPDRGMYDAINRGLRLASGEIVGLLNTDDLLAPGCLEAVAGAFGRNPDALAVVGGTTTFVEGPVGRTVVESDPAIQPDELWVRLIQGHPVTNAWFYRPSVFERVGYFDDRYRYSADRYFLIRLALDGGVRPIPIPQVLYFYRQHAGSATISTADSRSAEYGRMRMRFLQEDVDALDELLARPDLPAEVRRLAGREFGVRCYRLAATALYHRRMRLAVGTAGRAWHKDIRWPLVFVRMGLGRVWKELIGRE